MMRIQKKEKTGESFWKRNRSKIQLGSIVAALVAALALFAGMVYTQRKVLGDFEKKQVYLAEKQIPRGTLLNEDNVSQYMVSRQVDAGWVPASAITDPSELYGMRALYHVGEGSLLSEDMFESPEEILGEMEQPVLLGVRAEDLYQVVGGVLRSGDRIHIYQQEEESGKTVLRWENLYVEEVFDNTGERVGAMDTGGSAVRLNLYLEQKDVEAFYQGISAKTLRLVKVCQ